MKRTLIFFVFLFLSCILSAQNVDKIDDERLDSLIDKAIFDDEELASIIGESKKYQFIYSRFNFENRTYFAGRDIDTTQVNATGHLAYFHSCGINLAISGSWYSKFDPTYTLTSFSIGYNNKINSIKNFRFRVSYDRYFYTKGESVNDSIYSSGLNFGTTYRKKWGGSRIDASFLMGKISGNQLSWDIFGDLTLIKFSLLNKLEFEPEVSLLFGNEAVIYSKIGMITGPFGGRRPGLNFVTENKFGLLNTELKLPLTLTLGDFDFELGYNINLPRSLDPNYSYNPTRYFNFSVGYMISL